MSILEFLPPRDWLHPEKNCKNHEKMCNRQLFVSWVWSPQKMIVIAPTDQPKKSLSTSPVNQICHAVVNGNALETLLAFVVNRVQLCQKVTVMRGQFPQLPRRFINRSFRCMTAYQKGLTGKAALWAVWQQKSHLQVSQQAMMSINAVLN